MVRIESTKVNSICPNESKSDTMGLATAGGAIGEALHKWFAHDSAVGASSPLEYGQALAEGAADTLEFWLAGGPPREGNDDQGCRWLWSVECELRIIHSVSYIRDDVNFA